jgi:hypothetical protein
MVFQIKRLLYLRLLFLFMNSQSKVKHPQRSHLDRNYLLYHNYCIVHPVYEQGHIIPYVGNFTKEKSWVNMFEFPTGILILEV